MTMAIFSVSVCGELKVTSPDQRLSSCFPTEFSYYENGFAQSIWPMELPPLSVLSSQECGHALKELCSFARLIRRPCRVVNL